MTVAPPDDRARPDKRTHAISQRRGAETSPQRRGAETSPQRRGAEKLRRKRRRRRHIVIATIMLVGTANVVVGGAYAYLRWRLGQIHRVSVPGEAPDVGSVMNVLLVGSDSRARLTGEEAAQAGKGEVTGERTDTIIMIHIDPKQDQAIMVSIPRDLYLPIAGTGRSDRINSAFNSGGGAARLIATVQQDLGVQINHYAEVDFVGFQGIVDAIGGVTVYVPAPARDDFSGLDIPTPGCVTLHGEQALAWVRSRHYEYLSNGQWITDPRSDLGRIERQQDFIRRVLSKAVSSGLSNPLTLNRLLAIGTANLTVDSQMSTSDMTTLARRFKDLDPATIDTRTLPTTDATIDGADVLLLNKDEAQADIDAMNGKAPVSTPVAEAGAAGAGALETSTTLPAIPASSISVRVLNGTGTAGKAARVATALKAGGFKVVGTGDSGGDLSDATVVRYRPGAFARADVVAASLQSTAVFEQDPKVVGADVVLVLGTKDEGVKAPASSTVAPTTTTTSPPALVPSGAAEKRC